MERLTALIDSWGADSDAPEKSEKWDRWVRRSEAQRFAEEHRLEFFADEGFDGRIVGPSCSQIATQHPVQTVRGVLNGILCLAQRSR
jgi:hypothetical protein